MLTKLYAVPIETGAQQVAAQALHREWGSIAGGYTRTGAEGFWVAPDGEHFRETSILTLVSGDEDTIARCDEAFYRYGESAGEKALYSIVLGEASILPVAKRPAA